MKEVAQLPPPCVALGDSSPGHRCVSCPGPNPPGGGVQRLPPPQTTALVRTSVPWLCGCPCGETSRNPPHANTPSTPQQAGFGMRSSLPALSFFHAWGQKFSFIFKYCQLQSIVSSGLEKKSGHWDRKPRRTTCLLILWFSFFFSFLFFFLLDCTY